MEGDLAAVVVRSGVRVADRVSVPRSMLGRLRGLLGRPSLQPGEGFLLDPCNGVHTVGMRYPIDVLFLDEAGRVACAVHRLHPGRVVPYVRGARQAIELPAGTLRATGVSESDEVWLVSANTFR